MIQCAQHCQHPLSLHMRHYVRNIYPPNTKKKTTQIDTLVAYNFYPLPEVNFYSLSEVSLLRMRQLLLEVACS